MKPPKVFARLVAIAVLALWQVANVRAADRNPRSRQGIDPGKDSGADQGLAEAIDLTIGFYGEYGQTITDENGTTYHVDGQSFYENKVYPPEYWGVFPLYFFGTTVGVTIGVENQSDSKDARLRLEKTCHVLRTDGSNGAELSPPETIDVGIAAGGTKTVDASFGAEYVSGAESGLDRLLVKVFGAPAVIYTSVEHLNGASMIRLGDATEGLGQDGANEIDTFAIEVVNGGTSVSVTTKTATEQETSVLNGVGDSVTDSLGFKSTLVAISENVYVLAVESVSNRHALSHVDFDFGIGARVVSPAHGSTYMVARTSSDGDEADGPLLLLKEAVFCPPEVDAETMEALGSAAE